MWLCMVHGGGGGQTVEKARRVYPGSHLQSCPGRLRSRGPVRVHKAKKSTRDTRRQQGECRPLLTVDVSPTTAAGTHSRSAGTLHDQRQVSRNSLARSSGAGPGPGPGGRSGVVGGVPGLAAPYLEDSSLSDGATWATSVCAAIWGLDAGMWY